ncbi:MAG: ABC transporter substrate-binding protein [Candidatus Rokubacteria bacterium]|nr:ABC transporter substrate-binding protein [Candidatus Rokubacteria bacterium]
MKPALRFAASLLVVSLLVAGPAWGQARPSGELTIALSSFSTEILDPVLGGHIVKFYLSLIFDYLVGVTPDGQPSKDNGVASRWEASPDHKRWTFHLRKGIRFHNGDALTADDVKFSLLRAMGKRSTTGYAGPLRALVQDIETPAPDRVVIVTKEPTLIIPPYLSRVLSTEGMILSKKYLEAKGDDHFARAPIGSGPYRFVEQVTGSHVKLEAVEGHWRLGTPKFKTVTFRLIPEETTRVAILRRGEADIIEISRDRVKEVERGGFPIFMRKDDSLLQMWWVQPWENTPVKDRRVREALNISIDRKELAATIFGGMADPGAIPFGLSWAFPDVNFKMTADVAYPYDPARAKKLLAEAGYGGGFPIEFYAFQLPGLPEGKAMAEAVAGYWQKIGVQPKLVPVDYGAFRKKWLDQSIPGAVGYYNMANRDWIGTYALIEKMAYTPSKTTTTKDPEIDGMVREVLRQTDREKINTLMRNIFLRLRSEHLGGPLVYLHTPYAASKKITKWNPGSVMYDLNIDELVTAR